MTVTDFVAIAGALVAVASVFISGLSARNGATKAELTSLRETIVALQNENGRLRARMTEYEASSAQKDRTIAGQAEKIAEQATKIAGQAEEIVTLRDELEEVRAQLDNMAKRKTGRLSQ
jgi:chromosome segregation ATPase